MDAPKVGNCAGAADDCQRAEIAVAEGAWCRPASDSAIDHSCHVFAVLRGDRGKARQRPAIAPGEAGDIADREYLRVARNRTIRPDLHRSVARGIDAQPGCCGARLGAGAPEHIGALDPFAGCRHTGWIDVFDGGTEPNLDPEAARVRCSA